MESWTIKFRLVRGAGRSAIGEIGRYLRIHGSGSHWIERCRGDIFVNVTDKRDESILVEKFSHLVQRCEDGVKYIQL
jgi:hypothetical protein